MFIRIEGKIQIVATIQYGHHSSNCQNL